MAKSIPFILKYICYVNMCSGVDVDLSLIFSLVIGAGALYLVYLTDKSEKVEGSKKRNKKIH